MGAGEGFTKGQWSRKFYFSRVSDRGTRDEAEDPSDTYMECILLLFSLRLETYTQFGSLSKFGGPIWKCCIKAKVLHSFCLTNLGCGKCCIKAKGVIGF